MGILNWFRRDRGGAAEEPDGYVSGSAAYPTRRDVFLALLDRVVGAGDGEYATFTVAEDDDRWVQVARDDGLVLNVCYRYQEPPEEVLPVLGLELPEGCELQSWEPSTFMTMRMTGSNDAVAGLLENLFGKLLVAAGRTPIRGRLGD